MIVPTLSCSCLKVLWRLYVVNVHFWLSLRITEDVPAIQDIAVTWWCKHSIENSGLMIINDLTIKNRHFVYFCNIIL